MAKKLLVQCLGSSCPASFGQYAKYLGHDPHGRRDTHILIQCQLPDRSQRVILVRPSVRRVKNLEIRLVQFTGIHDLHCDRPGRVLATLDRFVHVADVVVWVFACQTECFGRIHFLDARVGLDVPFDVLESAVL